MRCHARRVRRWWQSSIFLACLTGLSACNNSKPATETAGHKGDPEAPKTVQAANDTPNIALRLKVGDKFPLQKTVVTTLVQSGGNDQGLNKASKEFLLTITVEAMPQSGDRAGQKQMGVKFHSVRFSRELNGKKLDYDSRSVREPIPLSIQPYHGLVGNSFSFWLGQDNQIEGIVDFDKFVERCLKNVPKERFEDVWNNLATQTGADGIANFVDDSIGLLPRSRVDIGESWTVTRRTQQPIPMVCKNRYTLQHLDGKQAEVSILGEILPGAFLPSAIPGAATRNINMSIAGGKATGSCTIDLRTGLPIHSQVEQFMDMNVKLQNGDEFVQHKQTITTIRAFPVMDTSGDQRIPAAQEDAERLQPAEQGDSAPERVAHPPPQTQRR